MPSNSLPDADLSLPEMKTKSPSCPSGGVHMYADTESLYFMNLMMPGVCQYYIKILDVHL